MRLSLLFLMLLASLLRGKEVIENDGDGKPHLRYNIDAKGLRSGTFEELFANGKVKVKGVYSRDRMDGTWTVYSDAGKTLETMRYRAGVLEGPYQRNYPSGHPQMVAAFHADDFAGPITTFDEHGTPLLRLIYPRPMATVLAAWNALAPEKHDNPKMLEEPHVGEPYKAGVVAPESLQAALRYTMLYRFLSGLQFQNLSIDPHDCDLAQHGAVILKKLNMLTHEPNKPDDMDDAFFKKAYAGCHESNIDQGDHSILGAIDDFMDDSDSRNIAIVGHRQWIMAPGLQKIGFGACNEFVTMHVVDSTSASGGNIDVVTYPGTGYYPVEMIHGGAAWSVHLGMGRYKVDPATSLKVAVAKLDEHFQVDGEPTQGKVVAVVPNSSTGWNMIIFRPGMKATEGRYVVEIAGIRSPGGAPLPFSYLVDLRKLPNPEPPAKRGGAVAAPRLQ